MIKSIVAMAAVFTLVTGAVQGQGFLSGLKDKVTGGGKADAEAQAQAEAQQAQAQQQAAAAQQTPPPAEAGKSSSKKSSSAKGKAKVTVVEGTPPPAAEAKPTPDKETIRKGAAKLKGQMAVERVPSDLFQKYAGRWKGDFWVYTPSGQLEESKSVAIEYKVTGKNTMEMETYYVDRISKTWVVAETATYENNGDTVKVTIRRPNNETATQTGRYNDGQLFLTADIADGVENYRERVDGARRLLVDGFGVYSGKGDSHVFIGRFLRER